MGDNVVKLKEDGIDISENKKLDSIELDRKSYIIGLLKFIVFTGIAVLVFFIPLNINGKSDVLFSTIYNFFIDALGNFGLWMVTLVIIINAILSFYGKFIAKEESKVKEYYAGDSILHPFFYLLGAVFMTVYSLNATIKGFNATEVIVGPATGGTVVPSIVMGVAWIIPVGAFFIPFLLNYGVIDLFGAVLEPFMRPVFKVPGASAVDAMTSFVSSSSMAVLVTSRLYKAKVYTKREAAVIATSFSAVSVGFAYLVIKTAGLEDYFIPVYFTSFFIAFLITGIMVRIPPLSRKPDIYADGRIQDQQEVSKKATFGMGNFRKGINRAIKKAYTAESIFKEVKSSLIDGYVVFPKVLSLLSAAGILGLIIAEYTPFFEWIGYLFIPLLKLFAIPNAPEIAASIPIGIAEMFLPVLLIADKVELLDIGARYFVTTVSMVQIIFLSETIVVMLATKLPVKFKELVICFFERTLLAIPIVALFMHILF